jgi:serpin B
MKTLASGISLAAIALCLAGCASSTDPVEPKPQPTPLQLSAVEKQLVGEANSFSFALLQQVVAETAAEDNVFISPLSASYALGMAFNGAGGATKEEMRTVLGFAGLADSQINESYQHLFELLPNADADVRVDLANSIWLREGFGVRPEFLDINQRTSMRLPCSGFNRLGL